MGVEGVLRRANEDGIKLEIIYLSNGNRLTQRVVKVLRVDDKEMLAFCYTRKQIRKFKKQNILSAGSVKKMKGA